MLNLASGTEDVSRANWIAMLVMDVSIWYGNTYIGGDILVNGFVVVQTGVSLACV
jgi:hypothetical protein